MRIIAGQYRGRKLISPQSNDIRPTSDKMRGAIFNALQSRMVFEGAIVADLFCGSGALGLEAISRGAQRCYFLDKNARSLQLAKDNSAQLGCSAQCHFIKGDATAPGTFAALSNKIGLFLCDPPYAQGLVDRVLDVISRADVLTSDAMGAVECEAANEPYHEAFTVMTQKKQGETQYLLMKYQGSELA